MEPYKMTGKLWNQHKLRGRPYTCKCLLHTTVTTERGTTQEMKGNHWATAWQWQVSWWGPAGQDSTQPGCNWTQMFTQQLPEPEVWVQSQTPVSAVTEVSSLLTLPATHTCECTLPTPGDLCTAPSRHMVGVMWDSRCKTTIRCSSAIPRPKSTL